MKKILANLICCFIPSRSARHAVRSWFVDTDRLSIDNSDFLQVFTNDVCRKISLVKNDDIWTLPNGVKLYLPLYPWDYIQKIIANEHRFFEQDILEELRKYIPDGATILDIGANIGNHSVFWSILLNAKRIHAFEPIPKTYRMLCKNIEINGLEKVVIPYNVALGNIKSDGDISVAYAENIGATSVCEVKAGYSYSVKIERLDDINLGESKIDFCKIDTEGFELKTLAGMKKTLERYRPIVFVESLEDGQDYPLPKGFESNAPKVKDFFRGMGYQDAIFFPPYNWLFLPAAVTQE